MNGLYNFLTYEYPKICDLAYNLGKKSREMGMPNICNLTGKPFVTPSGNILKVYKEAWEYGWKGFSSIGGV